MRPVRKADNLTISLCRCHEIWNLNFLEPSGPLQACNGTDLPVLFPIIKVHIIVNYGKIKYIIQGTVTTWRWLINTLKMWQIHSDGFKGYNSHGYNRLRAEYIYVMRAGINFVIFCLPFCLSKYFKGQKKGVKFTLVQALRLCTGRTAHRGSRGIALPFHDHGTRSWWGVSATPRPLSTPEKDPVPIVQEAEKSKGERSTKPGGAKIRNH
jgi:hypothetical protein